MNVYTALLFYVDNFRKKIKKQLTITVVIICPTSCPEQIKINVKTRETTNLQINHESNQMVGCSSCSFIQEIVCDIA